MDALGFAIFLGAALAIAVSPGPGLLYVATRTLAGGRRAGLLSTFGTAIGGLVHVVAGAFGVSALLMASAEAFTVLKLLGALYLVWLGVRLWREARTPLSLDVDVAHARHAFRDGVLVEALNPKTAAFFLAFIPQFVDPASGDVTPQFALLGAISVLLNTAADIVVLLGASSIRAHMLTRPAIMRRARQTSAAVLCGLGLSLALARRPG